MACQWGMLVGSDCNNKMLGHATGIKKGQTVGLWREHWHGG
jgi:hypothetical protein